MTPASPVIPGHNIPETIFAKDQPEYIPLPVILEDDGCCLSRWHLTWRERLRVLLTGDIYHWQHTFRHPLQPISMATKVELNAIST